MTQGEYGNGGENIQKQVNCQASKSEKWHKSMQIQIFSYEHQAMHIYRNDIRFVMPKIAAK